MDLTRGQKKLLRFVFNRFPSPFSGSPDGVRPRSTVNPPSLHEIREALKLSDQQCQLLLDFATEHQLLEKFYRYGTAEYATVQLDAGRIIHMAATGPGPPPDVDPADERYGFFCYQITDRGIRELNQPGPLKRFATFLNDHYKGCLIPLVYTAVGAIIGGLVVVYLIKQFGWDK